jgi:MFS family permease
MATFGTSSVLGPVIGGFFAGQGENLGVTGWRWVFLVNVPVGIAALVVVFRTLRLSHTPRTVRIDWWGAIALVVALVPLLTVAEQGRDWGWGSGRLIPLRLFRIRAAAVTITASIAIGAAMFGGILTLPLVVGLMSGALISGQLISRTGRTRAFPRLGSALIVVGLLLLSTTSADTSLVVIDLFMLVLDLGLGNCMQPLLLIMQSAVPPTEFGVATSSATFFRQIGGTVGVTAFLSILFSTVGGNIADEFERASRTEAFQQVVANRTPADAAVLANGSGAAAQVQADSSFIETLSPARAHPFKQGFAESMDVVFLIGVGVGVIALLLLLLMPAVELRATSASAASRAEAEGGGTRGAPR